VGFRWMKIFAYFSQRIRGHSRENFVISIYLIWVQWFTDTANGCPNCKIETRIQVRRNPTHLWGCG
jgi:hypothetical protein